MLLAVDIGNTDVVAAVLNDGEPVGQTLRTPSDPGRDAAQYAAELSAFLAREDIAVSELDTAVLCSVVPPLTETLRAAIHSAAGLDALVVGAALDSGLTLAIEEPETLGADIIAADAAAAELYPLPVIVFDYGSATTVTAVDEQRVYRGGVILAGMKLSLQALARGTAQLPAVDLAAPGSILATETADALCGGAVYGTAAMTDGMIERMETALGRPCTAVATGGLGRFIAPHCRRPIVYDEHLVFRGMALLARKNAEKK